MKSGSYYEDDDERRYWLNYWHYGAFAIDGLAQLAHCLRVANELQVNDVGFDIHIQGITPHITGGVTTSIGGFQEFNDLQDLSAILQNALDSLKMGTILRQIEDTVNIALGETDG